MKYHMMPWIHNFLENNRNVTVEELREAIDTEFPREKPMTYAEAFPNFFIKREKPKPYRQIAPIKVMQLAKEYGFTLIVVPDTPTLEKEEIRVLKSLVRNELIKLRFEVPK